MHKPDRKQWLDRFQGWAASQPDLRAVLLVGSASRSQRPADEWSDFDFVLVSTHPRRYLNCADWLAALGNPLFSFVERDFTGEPIERRALFEDGLDADFLVFAPESACQGFPGTPVMEIMERGWRALLDRDGLSAAWPAAAASRPARQPPEPQEFLDVVHDFWFHAAWTAKKLRRGELWVAATCNNVYMKRLLLRMIEWHALATHGLARDVWFDGRFIETWAAADVLEELPGVLAHYDAADVWRALQASMRLFHRMACETMQRWGYAYPAAPAEKVMARVAAWTPEHTGPA